MDPKGLSIGPGFQQWIADHQATPVSDEMYFSSEMSTAMVEVAGADGKPVKVMLYYNKLINEVVPFYQAVL